MTKYNYIPTLTKPHSHPIYTPYYSPTTTLFSPLFQSLTSEMQESLLNHVYGKGFMLQLSKVSNDFEKDIYEMLLSIQNSSSTLVFQSTQTMEILFEIPLTKDNLNKTITELIPSSVSFFITALKGENV